MVNHHVHPMNGSLLSLGSPFEIVPYYFPPLTFIFMLLALLCRAVPAKYFIQGLEPSCSVACNFSHSIVLLCSFRQVTYIFLALISSTVTVVGNIFPRVLLNQHLKTLSPMPN